MASNTGFSSPGELDDDLQHLRRRGLLLQRLGEIVGALLHLVEQPRVLDRDHRLVGKGLDQFDLLVGEWPHLLTIHARYADRFPSRSNGTREQCPEAAQSSGLRDTRSRDRATHIRNVNGLCLQQASPDGAPRRSSWMRDATYNFRILGEMP